MEADACAAMKEGTAMTQNAITPGSKQKSIVQCVSMAPNIVVVPDMSAVELTALAKRDLKLTYLDGDYAEWDYNRGVNGKVIEGRGLKFETIIVPKTEIKASGTVLVTYARDHFSERGFHGNAAAFTQWRRQHPELGGYHASIPEDNACRRDPHSDDLCVPCSYFDDDGRELSLCWIGGCWGDCWSFVGFRVVS